MQYIAPLTPLCGRKRTANPCTLEYMALVIGSNKSLPYSGVDVIPAFLVCVLVVFPLWLFLLLPFTICWQLILHFSFTKKVETAAVAGVNPLRDNRDQPNASAIGNVETRRFELVLFGATGYTGKMAAVYLAKRYGTSVQWAIAGRRITALQKLKNELVSLDNKLQYLPIIIADSSDSVMLDNMVRQTKVVITTVGPFDKYGTKLVESCAIHGTHYCDITGETDWVRQMIELYDTTARKSGARIVHFCGHDCVPWDLVTLECALKLRKDYDGEALQSINFFDELSSAPSGGTIATVLHALTNRVKYKSQIGFDPLLLRKCSVDSKQASCGETLCSTDNDHTAAVKSNNNLIIKVQSMLGYSKDYHCWCGPFVMSTVMANCVRRSNVLNNYGREVTYREALVYPSIFAGIIDITYLLLLGTVLLCPPVRLLVTGTPFLPTPGQGPTKSALDNGFLRVTAFAEGCYGSKVQAMMYFPTDPGYRDTARMLVESGLSLALDVPAAKITVGGGIWTPASCQGHVLTERLVKSGSVISLQ